MKYKSFFAEFQAFDHLFHFLRPKEPKEMTVYEVDAGTPEDYNIVCKAAIIENDEIVGEPVTLIIAKEWVLENLEEILANVPDPETASA